MASLINKARKPKFELHLHIYDLNNVPLGSGTSMIKWHLPHSMHGEHRGRTAKCPINNATHRVSYNYSRVVPLRITIDRNNNLSECPIEFEVVQEFPMAPGGRDEKIVLGEVKLNLSEYVEESENFPRRSVTSKGKASLEHARERILGPALGGSRRLSAASKNGNDQSNANSSSTTNAGGHLDTGILEEDSAEEGIVRRYLMQESKINSTLKIGILMIQIDGERNYVAPPLKTAPMFGGIAGIMTGEAVDPVDDNATGTSTGGAIANTNKSRDASELQDMYRRALAASWSCQPGELPADECVEDIFSGGDGWKVSPKGGDQIKARGRNMLTDRDHGNDNRSSGSTSDDEAAGGTLRPSDMKRMRQHMQQHARQHSASSDKSFLTITGGAQSGNRHGAHERTHSKSGHRGHVRHHSREASMITQTGFENAGGLRSRSDSLTSLAPTLGSLTDREHGRSSAAAREGFRRPREVDEFEVRDDLISWALPGTVT